MKHFIICLCLLVSSNLQSQKTFTFNRTLFAGTSITSDLESNVFLQYEEQSDWVKLQLTYLTDLRLKEQRFNAKLGIRPLNWRKEDLGFWVYMPYLNMNLREGFKYNSPFSFELQWQKKLAIVLDTGFKDVNIQIRYRTKIFHKKS